MPIIVAAAATGSAVHEVRSAPGKKKAPYVILDQQGVLVVYKPPHWTMTTTMEMPRNTSVQAWLGDSLGHIYPYLQQDPLQAGLVQRLDVETSGPVVVATRPDTFRKMWQLRSAGHFYREYVVLLHGKLPIKHCYGTIDYSLNTRRRSSKVSERHGQPAKTRYQAIAAYTRKTSIDDPKSKISNYTLLRVRILTGRLHQIRVHLREFARRLGLPVCGVVGDYKYLPRAELLKDREFCPRVFLHARVLRFPLPGKQRRLCRICCELPVDLMRVLRALTPHEELTAKLAKLRDFLLRGNDSEAPVPAIGDGAEAVAGAAIHEEKRQSGCRDVDLRFGSRSPSHWRALPRSPAKYEQSEGTTREPSEERFEASESALWNPDLDQPRHRHQQQHKSSPSPLRWCPPPCSPAMSEHSGEIPDEHDCSFSSSPSLTPGPSPGSSPARDGSASVSVSPNRGRQKKRSRSSSAMVKHKRSQRRSSCPSRSRSSKGDGSRVAHGISLKPQSGVAPNEPGDEAQERETALAKVQDQAEKQRHARVEVQEREHAGNSYSQRELHSALPATSLNGESPTTELPTEEAELPTEEVPSSVEPPEQAAASEASTAGPPVLEQQSFRSASGSVEGTAANEAPPGPAAKRRKRAAKATLDAVTRRWEDDPFGLWQS